MKLFKKMKYQRYQVCQKWLKDRKGRQLTEAEIAHYQKIVVALHETIRIISEIDAVIEGHGGWPVRQWGVKSMIEKYDQLALKAVQLMAC
jgi:hypothetical protein